MLKKMRYILPALLAALLLAGCAQTEEIPSSNSTASVAVDSEAYVDVTPMDEEVELSDEVIALAAGPAAISKHLMPQASGTLVEKTDKAVIDYSNTKDGYVMAQFTAQTSKRTRVKVTNPVDEYIYDITPGEWFTFPLVGGNGGYTVKVYENTSGKKNAVAASVEFQVTLTDEFAPFLRPNQYVDYESAPNAVALAEKLAGNEADPMKKVEKIYEYVISNLTYDKQRAATVQTGYVPDLDDVLKQKKGICFDYASLMAGMLRSQGVPCKLIFGHAGEAYHAWISVWSEGSGWVNAAVYFDGKAWQRMDPTFASTSNSSDKIMKYIGDGKNYHEENLF